jgi:hypothetical protein
VKKLANPLAALQASLLAAAPSDDTSDESLAVDALLREIPEAPSLAQDALDRLTVAIQNSPIELRPDYLGLRGTF